MRTDMKIDEFCTQFTDFAEFKTCLKELDDDSKWGVIPAKDVHFVPLSSIEAVDLTDTSFEAYEDSMRNLLPIAAVLEKGEDSIETFAVRPYLYKNIKQHHEDDARVLRKMVTAANWEALCNHLNLSRPFLTKEILYLIRGEKISGWFSDYNNNWGQHKQFSYVEECMATAFPNFEFQEASVSHYFTMGRYALDKALDSETFREEFGDAVLESYMDAWKSAGGDVDELRNAVPLCRFTTGESGLTSISLSAILKLPDGSEYPLGGALSVNHRGSDDKVWDKFETFPDQIAALYQKGLSGLSYLCKRLILHPAAAVTYALKPFTSSIPKELIEDLILYYETVYDAEEGFTCYAIEIFNEIRKMVSHAAEKQTPMKQLQNVELLARMVTTNWDAYDNKTPLKLFGGKPKDTSDVDWLSL